MGGGWSLRRHPAAAAGGSSASAHETSIQEAAPLPRSFAPAATCAPVIDTSLPPTGWTCLFQRDCHTVQYLDSTTRRAIRPAHVTCLTQGIYRFAYRMMASTINLESEKGKTPGGGSRGRPGE